MAYVRDVYTQNTGNVSSYVLTSLPVHKTGDLILIIGASNNSYAQTIDGGWSAISGFTPTSANATKVHIWSKIATSSDETPPTITCTAYNTCTCFSIADHDGVDSSGRLTSGLNVSFQQSPSFNTLTDKCLVIQGTAWNLTTRNRWDYSAQAAIGFASAGIATSYSTTGIPFAGAVRQENNYTNSTTAEGQSYSVAIKNSVGGSLTPYVAKGFPKLPGVNDIAFSPTGALNNSAFTYYNPYDLLQTLQGDAVNTLISTAISNSPIGDAFGPSYSGTSSSNGVWAGMGIQLVTAVNFNKKILSFCYAHSGSYISSRGINVIFGDTSGNWVSYRCRPSTAITANIQYVYNISPTEVTSEIIDQSASPIDWSLIDKICWLGRKSTVNSWVIYINEVYLVSPTDTMIICGGGQNCKANDPYWLKKLVRGFGTAARFQANGVSQGINNLPLIYGNGAEPVYVDFASSSSEQPQGQVIQSLFFDYLVADDLNGVIIEACALCTVKVQQGIIASEKSNNFKISETSSISANYSFLAQQFKNSSASFIDGLTIDSAQFIGCGEVTGSCTYNTCGFSLQTDDYALTCASGTSLLGCTFTAPTSGSDYAVRLRTPGLYDFTGSDFINYYRDVMVDATSGEVTIKLGLEDTIPTYATSGASVTFDQPVTFASFTVQGMISGSRCFVKNTTTDNIITNDIVDSSGIYQLIYTNGEANTFTNGDTYKVIVNKYDGVSAYLEEVFTGIVSSAGATVPVSQVADATYNVYGIVGADLTGIQFNTTSIDIDLDSADDYVEWKDVYARYVYTISTSGGIETFTGLVEAVDAVNYKFSSEIVFNNLSATPVVIGGDGQGKRVDGGLMFGVGLLQINNGTSALAVNVGGSAILPSDITDIAAATKARIEEPGSKLTKAERRSRLIPGAL